MKKIRTIVLAAFAALSMSASAQEPFATFYLQYNPTQFHHKEIYGADTKDYFNQVAIGYNYATPLFGIPLYLEFGGAFQYSFKSGDGYKVNMLAGKIPVAAQDAELSSGGVDDGFQHDDPSPSDVISDIRRPPRPGSSRRARCSPCSAWSS